MTVWLLSTQSHNMYTRQNLIHLQHKIKTKLKKSNIENITFNYLRSKNFFFSQVNKNYNFQHWFDEIFSGKE